MILSSTSGAYRVGTVPRSARLWPECAGPFGAVALTQLLDPEAGEVVIAGDLAFAAPFQLCRETGAYYVLKPDTCRGHIVQVQVRQCSNLSRY
jgi:hypothetical protein